MYLYGFHILLNFYHFLSCSFTFSFFFLFLEKNYSFFSNGLLQIVIEYF